MWYSKVSQCAVILWKSKKFVNQWSYSNVPKRIIHGWTNPVLRRDLHLEANRGTYKFEHKKLLGEGYFLSYELDCAYRVSTCLLQNKSRSHSVNINWIVNAGQSHKMVVVYVPQHLRARELKRCWRKMGVPSQKAQKSVANSLLYLLPTVREKDTCGESNSSLESCSLWLNNPCLLLIFCENLGKIFCFSLPGFPHL